MPEVQFSNRSRWITIINATGKELENIVLHYSNWSFGQGSRLIATRLAPGDERSWSLSDEWIRASTFWVGYSMSDNPGHTVKSPLAQPPGHSYWRWIVASIQEDSNLFVGGRAQGVPIPAYEPWFYQYETSGVEIPKSASDPTEGHAPGEDCTQFLEVLAFAGSAINLKTISFATKGEPLEITIDRFLRNGSHFDVEFEADRVQVTGCKVVYTVGNETRVDTLDLNDWSVDWALIGTLLIEGGDLLPIRYVVRDGGSTKTAEPISVVQPRTSPKVVIEEDPDPPFPSPFCNIPKRVRNEEAYHVYVRYAETYKAEGPRRYCSGDARTSIHETVLGPRGHEYLGCATYQTPSMWCKERRQWAVISASRVGQ